MFSESRREAGASRADAMARRRRAAKQAAPKVQDLEARRVLSHFAFAPRTFGAIEAAQLTLHRTTTTAVRPLVFRTVVSPATLRAERLQAVYQSFIIGPSSIPTIPTTTNQESITRLAGPPGVGASAAPTYTITDIPFIGPVIFVPTSTGSGSGSGTTTGSTTGETTGTTTTGG